MDKTINATVFSAEEFSPYEKTIYYLAISTSLIKSYPIAIDDIGIISSLLKVDDTLLNKALDMYSGEALPFYVAFGKDIIEPIKAVAEFSKKHPNLEMKVGIVDGKVTGLDELNKLATIPSREGLLTMFASGLLAIPRDFAICLDLHSKNLEN